MFGLGFTEILVIAGAALVFVGPKRLPELMRQVGKFFVQARRMTTDVRSSIDTVIRDAEQELHKEELEKVKKMLEDAKQTAASTADEVVDAAAIEAPDHHTSSSESISFSQEPVATEENIEEKSGNEKATPEKT